ncbi:hypothetical protein [Nitrosomonas communis]|uniref:Uncharacterized protein n=1 Tax=Nitrosomonas communis TaxID=44574 RepID=A0A1H2RGE7_9PROT|nr:hypothetical protein [Nitrosomonas communis]SDW17729.1 hypothetical protein SAMN05421882_100497 [Nitrosomonas communis]
MKNKLTDRMKDPFYASLLFQIEQMICQADDEAKSKGQILTDSQISRRLSKRERESEAEDRTFPRQMSARG